HMPLLDHFHAPLHPRHHWESFHSNWATRLADALNDRWLPPEFLAEEFTHMGAMVEIDVAAYEQKPSEPVSNGPPILTMTPPTWSPRVPPRTMPAVFPDSFEVRIFSTTTGQTLVGAIELVSPGNKDRAEERRAFTTKCASYLYQGISLIVIDIVTSRRANLHNQTMHLMAAQPGFEFPYPGDRYAAAHRPVPPQARAHHD